MEGKIISHYKVLEKLGGGGMGIVYKARDLKLDRYVALKFLPPSFSLDEEAKQRFIHEAKAASALEHNHICNIHEIDETDDGQLYIVMAYYNGETLKKKIEEDSLDIDEAINITIQIAEGLSKAHEKGIIHRDIKPANIFVTKDGVVKILDFGLAKVAGQSQITKTSSTVGTVAYMSPEQARGEMVDQRSDIWSLGVVLYEMITGINPFKAEYEQAVIHSIIDKEPEPIKKLRKDVPEKLDWIISKALEKKTADRYQSLEEFINDLLRTKDEEITSSRIKIPKIVIRKRYKKAILLFLTIITLTVLFVIFQPFLSDESITEQQINIAVISAENQTGDKSYDYLQKAIPNLLITNLEQSRFLSVLTWERMHDILKQLGESDVKFIDQNLGFRICRMDKIDAIVIPSYMKAGENFVTDVKVLDVSNKKLLKSANAKGLGIESVFEQIDILSEEISEGVGLSANEIESVRLKIAEVTTTSMEAYNYFLQGRDLYEKYYRVDARKLFEKAIELDSTYATVYLYLALSYRQIGNLGLRNETLKKAMNYSKRATEKERLYIEAAHAWFIEGNDSKEVSKFKELITKYPKESHAHRWLACYYQRKSMFEKAIEELNEELKINPASSLALNQISTEYSWWGKYKEALNYVKLYASLYPDEANAFDTMGENYLAGGNLDSALLCFHQALELKPDFGSDLTIAYIYALKEEYSQTFNWINKFVERTSSQLGAQSGGYVWKGFYNYWLGRFDQCKTDLIKAEQLANIEKNEYWKSQISWIRGWLFFETREYELSRKNFEKWYEFYAKYNPEHWTSPAIDFYKANLKIYLAFIDLREGKIDSCRIKLTYIEAILPSIDLFYVQLIKFEYDLLKAEVFLKENRIKEAIKLGEESEELKLRYTRDLLIYNFPFPKDILARAYFKEGEIDKCISEYEKLIKFDPKSTSRWLIYPKYHYYLAKLYEEKGTKDKAINNYHRFLQVWKNADEELPELIDANRRLKNLQ